MARNRKVDCRKDTLELNRVIVPTIERESENCIRQRTRLTPAIRRLFDDDVFNEISAILFTNRRKVDRIAAQGRVAYKKYIWRELLDVTSQEQRRIIALC